MSERLYEWQDPKTGEYVEEFFDVDTVPRIGEYARVGGRRLRRIPSIPDFAVEPDFGRVVTHQFSDADCARFGPQDKGQPRKLTATGGLQLNGRERANMEAKMADAGRTVRYDTGLFRNQKRKEIR